MTRRIDGDLSVYVNYSSKYIIGTDPASPGSRAAVFIQEEGGKVLRYKYLSEDHALKAIRRRLNKK